MPGLEGLKDLYHTDHEFSEPYANVQLEKDGKNIILMMDFYLEITKYVCQIVLLDCCCYRNQMQED